MSLLEQVRALAPYQWAANLKRTAVQKRREHMAGVLLQLPPRPVPAPMPELASLHLLTSSRDWLGALWSVRTFMEFLGESLPVYFHDDGTLGTEAISQLRNFLPGAVVLSAAEAEGIAEQKLKNRPQCRAARHRHIMTHKLFDPALVAPGPRYLLLDSDLLFFRHPTEIAQWLKGKDRVNLWNEDQGEYLNLTTEEAWQRHNVKIFKGMNAGFGAVWRDSVDFDLLEEYFAHESVWVHPHRVEQTAYALLSGRFGARLLPRTYLIDTDRPTGLPDNIVMKHYVGKIRDLFFSEGINHLLAQGLVPTAHAGAKYS